MPAVQLVEAILNNAIEARASDIHFESTASSLQVRLRVDGLLFDYQSIPLEVALQVLARIKVLSRLDVAEKRIPQDGKFWIEHVRGAVDLRVATFPSLYGEKIVIRILEVSKNTRELLELGLAPSVYKNLLSLIHKSTGFFLVTGPTGSGKTTTLYAMLRLIQTPEKNIITLEDPIEYNIEGITQGQIMSDIGFTFARGMRSLLRQDPDVIMVGEIRDRETAEVAIQASLTGHLILSTSHTNDAASAVMRLMDMGIPSFLINATLSGVLAQRLVRVLCGGCKYNYDLKNDEIEYLQTVGISLNAAYKADGCDSCKGRGYTGRVGVFELLIITQQLKELIGIHPSYNKLAKQAVQDGMVTMHDDAAQKIEAGITSVAELARVL